jgi:hypothetical protein
MKRSPVLPEVFLTTAATSKAVARAVRDGTARKLGPRLFTTDMRGDPARIVARNIYPVISLLAPGTVISYRTAIENRPAEDGSVFLSAPYERRLELPGAAVRLVKGPGPLPGDRPLLDVYLASRARALLECLKPSRARAGVARGLPRARIEEELERDLRGGGADALNRLRDDARALAPTLDAAREFDLLHELIGGLLRTRPVKFQSAVALARAAGMPYDPERLSRFQDVFAALATRAPHTPPRAVSAPREYPEAFFHGAFFDSYFSNYIEGTQFKVEDAQEIVFHGVLPAARAKDAHDVLGTYRVVSSAEYVGRSVVDDSPDGFLERLRAAHREIMGGRPEERPGEWKRQENMVGTTVFVHPDLVEGTLRKGVELVRAIADPFHRALAMMFVLSEVHPFGDGNGRVSRAFMNAEVLSAGQPRILVPIIVRDEYLAGVRAVTRDGYLQTLVDVLSFGQRLTAAVDFRDYEGALAALRSANAFEEPRPGVRPRMPVLPAAEGRAL